MLLSKNRCNCAGGHKSRSYIPWSGMAVVALAVASGCQSNPLTTLSGATRVPPPATGSYNTKPGEYNNPAAAAGMSSKATASNATSGAAPVIRNGLTSRESQVVQAQARMAGGADQNVSNAAWNEGSPAQMLSTDPPGAGRNAPVRTADYTDNSEAAPIVSAASFESAASPSGNATTRSVGDSGSQTGNSQLQWQSQR